MTKKATNVDNDLPQFKAEIGGRVDNLEEKVDQLEATVASLREESEKRHSELLKTMLQQFEALKPAAPPTSTVVPTRPLSSPFSFATGGNAVPSQGQGINEEINPWSGPRPPSYTQGTPITDTGSFSFSDNGVPQFGSGNGRGSSNTQGHVTSISDTGMFSSFGHATPQFGNVYGRGSGPTAERV